MENAIILDIGFVCGFTIYFAGSEKRGAARAERNAYYLTAQYEMYMNVCLSSASLWRMQIPHGGTKRKQCSHYNESCYFEKMAKQRAPAGPARNGQMVSGPCEPSMGVPIFWSWVRWPSSGSHRDPVVGCGPVCAAPPREPPCRAPPREHRRPPPKTGNISSRIWRLRKYYVKICCEYQFLPTARVLVMSFGRDLGVLGGAGARDSGGGKRRRSILVQLFLYCRNVYFCKEKHPRSKNSGPDGHF